MSNDTHQAAPKEIKSIISFKNSFWLVIIIVGLFIAALNFVKAESGGGKQDETTITQPQQDIMKGEPSPNDSALKNSENMRTTK